MALSRSVIGKAASIFVCFVLTSHVSLAHEAAKEAASRQLDNYFQLDRRQFQEEPVSHKEFDNAPEDFQFVIVSDRTGGHRYPVFRQAIEKANLMQPEFVISVGDLIEGYSTDERTISEQWTEMDAVIEHLEAPFFYAPGNHDFSNDVMAEIWKRRIGADYYHFIYKNVLFLVMNSEQPLKGVMNPGMGKEQFEYAKSVLEENPDVRWTFVFSHQPLWKFKSAVYWPELESVLSTRPYTAFAGHMHAYDVTEGKGNQDHITLGSTGGTSPLRGEVYGEFDHITWVTMNDQGPVIVNLKLEGILEKEITTASFDEVFDKSKIFEPEVWYQVGSGEKLNEKRDVAINVTNPFDLPMSYSISFQSHPDYRLSKSSISRTLNPKQSIVETLSAELIGKSEKEIEEPLQVTFEGQVQLSELKKAKWQDLVRLQPFSKHRVSKTGRSVVLDGSLVEWPDLKHEFETKHNGTVKFDVLHDDSNLYIGFDIEDDHFTDAVSTGVSGSTDLLYIYLDGRKAEDSAYSIGSTQDLKKGKWTFLAIAPDDSGGNLPYEAITLKGFSAIGRKVDGRFTVEMVIPSKFLDYNNGEDWKEFRLNVLYKDVDERKEIPQASSWQNDWSKNNVLGSGLFVRD